MGPTPVEALDNEGAAVAEIGNFSVGRWHAQGGK